MSGIMSGIMNFVIWLISFGLFILFLNWNLTGIRFYWHKLRGSGERIQPLGYLYWFVGTWILLPLLMFGVAFIGELL